MSLNNFITVKNAIKIIENRKFSFSTEYIPLEKSNRRILSENIEVLLNVPPFSRSAMDGYAVRAIDTSNSLPTNPTYLEVVDEIGAGENSKITLKPFETVKIATGAPMPSGSDAVIMHENTEESGSEIKIIEKVERHQDMALTGEDLKKGEVILKKGQILNPNQLALIASAGYSRINVVKKPVVNVINTGNELVDPTTNLEPGMIINSNKYALKGLVEDSLSVPIMSTCADDLEIMVKQLKSCLKECDVIITTGGTAISKGDIVVDAVEELGEILIHGVSIKPGKPFGFGIIDKKPVFMLSGYPVAAAVQFDIFVRDKLLNMQRINRKIELLNVKAGSDVRSAPGKYNVIRAWLNGETVTPIRTKAGINKSITQSNCYILTDENTGKVQKGEICQVLPYKNLNIC